MYFQKLEQSNRINGSLKDLDRYLASLMPFYSRKINPLIFSNLFGYSKDMTIKLFNEAVRLEVLKVKYLIVDYEGNPIKTYYSYHEIPFEFYSEEPDEVIKTTVDNIQIWYELIDSPKEQSPIQQLNTLDPLKLSDFAETKDAFAAMSDDLGFW